MCSLRQAEHPRVDELTPIARYIAWEMQTNAHGETVKRMAELNRFSATACIAHFNQLPWWQRLIGFSPEDCLNREMSFHSAALLAWAWKVRQDGEWDHKPKIAARFHPRVPGGGQHYHLHGDTLYFYDVWSNIHYGYVGMAAAFSRSVLLDGAGLEQIGSDLARLSMPSKSAAVAGLRAFDAQEDRAAIEIGIALYNRNSNTVSAEDILCSVLRSRSIRTKPYAP